MKGIWVKVWHPDSPGSKVIVYRPWWKRKMSLFASLSEVLKSSKYDKPKSKYCVDVIEIHKILNGS